LRIATAIMCGVLTGLEAIHGAKSEAGLPLSLVHQDVGAHNVVVGNDGVARLTDLGTGKLVAELHKDGKPKAKLAYTSPHQILGHKIDRRADVYAASIMFIEIVTGRRPFEDVPREDLPMQIIAGMRSQDLRGARDLPRELLGVVVRGLARRPQDRFASAGEMAKAIVRTSMPAPAHEV